VLTVKDGANNLTTFIYDYYDRLSQVEFPLPTTGSGASNTSDYESYGYDNNGNLTSKRLRSGQSITLTYDALNRLTQEQFPSGTSLPVYYGYDLLNRTLMASNSSPTGPGVAYVYDALSRVTSMTQNSKTLSYGYDAAGNRTTITWPDTSNPLTATYVYDPLNHVTQIEQNGATSGTGLLATYAYDSLGRRTGISRAGGAGMSTSYGYDTVSRLGTLTQTLASSAGTTFTLGYNPANQVISRADSNGAFTVAPSAISLTYTANGLNQYSSITGGTQALSGGPQASLAYDPQGRIQSVTTSGTTSNFLYDGAFLAEEYNASGTTTARYVPGPGTDEPVTVYSGASLSYPNWYAADQEGSIIATANSSGTQVASFAYGPYGEPLTSAGAPSWAGARYRYTGQIVIAGAQTYFYKARMYDPSTGRFFQTDPAGFGGGVNIYAYAMNDPINGWDPTGLDDCANFYTFVPDGLGGFEQVSDLVICGSTLTAAGGSGGGVVGGSGTNESAGKEPKTQQPQNSTNCQHALEVADNLEKASKITGATALGTGVAGAGIEVFSGGLATPVAGLAEVAAGFQEVASLGLGAAATALRVGATGKLTSVVSFALPQVILNATGLAGISSLGKLAQSAAGVGYDNTLGNAAPQSECHT
jgi:RHS repeat-associated protein